MKTSLHHCFMHLKRHFDLSRPLQVPVSGAFMILKPLVVFIHDSLFLYTRHITQVCFPRIQRDSCHHGDGITTVAELQYRSGQNVHLVHILQLKYKLMDATVHIKIDFLLQQHFSWQARSLFFFASSICFIDGTQTHLCNRLLGSRTKG